MRASRSYHHIYAALLVLALSLPVFDEASAAGIACSSLFSLAPTVISPEQLNQAIHELSALRLNLDKAQAQGARSITLNFLQKDFDQKYAALSVYVEKHQIMTRAELLERLQQEIALLQHAFKKENEDSTKSTAHIEQLQEIASLYNGQKMLPHRLEAGTYKRNPVAQEIVIERPFEMMATLTTQIVWRKVVELLHQKFPREYDLALDPSESKNDLHPVEMISFNEVELWLWGLNQLSQKGEPALADIIIGHKAGDHYRLPRDKEWEYVFYGQDHVEIAGQIDNYAWHLYSIEPSNGTKPVAQKLAISKDGKDFYDLLGNVSELMDDYPKDLGPAMSQDEKPQSNAMSRLAAVMTRGGSFAEAIPELHGNIKDSQIARVNRRSHVGFRIVRDVNVPPQALAPTPVSISVPVPVPVAATPQAPVQVSVKVPLQIPQQIAQQKIAAPAPPVVQQKTSLWKKITGKLGW